MYIKFQDNIHIVSNYQSLVKGDRLEIRLLKDSHGINLLFRDIETRNWVLSHIWQELMAKTEFLDLDNELEVYYNSKKYKCEL